MLMSLAVVALAGAAATGRAALPAAACRSRDATSRGSARRPRAASSCVQTTQHTQWRTNGRACVRGPTVTTTDGTACATPIPSFATIRRLAAYVLTQHLARMELQKHQLRAERL